MGLFDFIRSMFGGSKSSPTGTPKATVDAASQTSPPVESASPNPVAPAVSSPSKPREFRERRKRPPITLRRLDYAPSTVATPPSQELTVGKPYSFALADYRPGHYFDLSRDADERWTEYFGVPTLKTPDDLANWLGISLGTLAWLTFRMKDSRRPKTVGEAHYHFQWKQKRSGGYRLIESPKEELKAVQQKILHEILDLVPPHPAAHGFVKGRSILSNAVPHVGRKFVLKLDLEEFYPSVKYSRVVAIFRSLGFSREVSLWLARLTISVPPWDLKSPVNRWDLWRYMTPHLPQGAPTSPALANLSAFGLDVRLSGLARSYGLTYTRYADDLTFSGEGTTIPGLYDFIPLASKVIAQERFSVNREKRKIIRNCQRQCVTGVVVNEKINVSRKEFDRLKAILHNCVKMGPTSQNRDGHLNFAGHLRGRIAHVSQLNPAKGRKLLEIYERIRW